MAPICQFSAHNLHAGDAAFNMTTTYEYFFTVQPYYTTEDFVYAVYQVAVQYIGPQFDEVEELVLLGQNLNETGGLYYLNNLNSLGNNLYEVPTAFLPLVQQYPLIVTYSSLASQGPASFLVYNYSTQAGIVFQEPVSPPPPPSPPQPPSPPLLSGEHLTPSRS